MRVLVTSTTGAGHFTPVATFIRALAGRCELVLAGSADLRERAQELGVELRVLGDPPPEELGAVFGRVPGLSVDEANELVVRDLFGRLRAGRALPDLLALVDELRPDVVLYESAAFAGPLAAQRAGIAAVRISIGLQVAEEYLLRVAEPALVELRTRFGIPAGGPPESAPALTLFPSSFEDPAVDGGASIARFREDHEPVDRVDARHVYITFGSVTGSLPHITSVFEEALAAVSELDVSVTLTVGLDRDPESLGTLPANVTVERWVDQRAVLARSSAIVCHAGGGTTLAALVAGRPVVAVPLFAADQYMNARRVEEAGVGRTAEPHADAIRTALEAVLGDDQYAARASAVAAEIAALPPVDEALDVLSEVVRS